MTKQYVMAGLGAGAIALSALIVSAVPATAAQGGAVRVQVRDRCDPVTFEAALGAGSCIGDGDVTFDELISSVASTGAHPKWRNNPTEVTIKSTDRLFAQNRGGEAHSFSEVAQFGGGCVQPLNDLLGLTPVPECSNPAVFPGGLLIPGMETSPATLAPGVHKFQCLIHPWMHTVVIVKGNTAR